MASSHVFLIIGKTGNGKSSVGNSLLGKEEFLIGRGMSTTTVRAEAKSRIRDQETIMVVDTPDVVNLEYSLEDRKKEVQRWKDLASPGHPTILLAVRCDVRYTEEEYAIYTKFKRLWGDNSGIKRHLVVAFTFCNMQEKDFKRELQGVCRELKDVLKDACNRYVLFNKENLHTEAPLDKLFDLLSSAQRPHKMLHNAPLCPQMSDRTKIVLVVVGILVFLACLVAVLVAVLR